MAGRRTVSFVISSIRRLVHKRAAIGDMFRARELITTIVGMMVALHTKRGHEIQAWLDARARRAADGYLQ